MAEKRNEALQTASGVFGVSRTPTDHDLREILERARAERHALGELIFDDQLRMLDSMILALRNKALSPDLADVADLDAMKELRAVLDQRARLLNLYPGNQQAPQAPVVNNYILNFGSGGVEPIEPYVESHAERVDTDSDSATSDKE